MKSLAKKITINFLFSFFVLHVVTAQTTISKLKFLSEYDVPHNLQFKNTTVGGLSGIDYDKMKNVYYLISDDRSAINPARFYTAKIKFSSSKIDSVEFVEVTTLLNAEGKAYPNSKQDSKHTPDPEALRYNPITHQMIWSSEGERIVHAKDTVLENPAVTMISTDGKYIYTFPLPKNMLMHATEKGPRQNGVFEGLTFADNYKTLFVNVEEPLYEDGPRAEVIDNNATVRILKFDMASKKCVAQYAYKLEPIAHEAITKDAFKINGIPDILSIGKNKMLVMERSFSTGNMVCTIKIFEADITNATNILNVHSVLDNKNITKVKKKLLLNMDDLGIYTDNVEGMTFGPDLPNGHKSLIMVVDNNFSPLEKTQFFLFEVIP